MTLPFFRKKLWTEEVPSKKKQGCNNFYKMLHPCSVIYIGRKFNSLTPFMKKIKDLDSKKHGPCHPGQFRDNAW